MNTYPPHSLWFWKTASAIFLGSGGWLGAWTPGTYPAASSNFTVDTAVRNDVVSFWHGVYQASEGYQNRHGWTGNYTAAAPYDSGVGTTAAVFVTDVERRLNFYRAMCNVPAATRLNTGATVLIDATDPTNLYHPASTPPLAASTTKSAAVQRAAYMIVRTYGYSQNGVIVPPLGDASAGISHDPLQAKCVGWTTAVWNANHYSDIGYGYYGPGAVDSYMAEDVAGTSTWNSDTGHRRMLIHPVSTDFATGDTPGNYDSAASTIRPPTNVIYVAPKASEVSPVTPRMVTYPPAGFFPAPLNPSRYWSLSYPGAGFAAATVTMTTAAGAAVPVTVVSRAATYGYPAIIWQITGTAAAVKSVTADTTFNVTVAGITGSGVPTSHSYSVTLINPNQITSDQTLWGAGSPATSTPASYQFTPPPKSEAIQVNCFQPQTTAWVEGAEDSPEPSVIASTTGTYAFRSTAIFPGYYPTYFGPISLAKSFRLTIPVQYDLLVNGAPEQSFELGREIVPGNAATLNFHFRRGLMAVGTNLAVESSNDGGATWTALGAAIAGLGSSFPDSAATADSRPLPASTTPMRIRFRLSVAPGYGFYADEQYPTYPTGILIDYITTTNCQWLDLKKTNELAATATSFELNPTTAGVALSNALELRLRLRTKLGNRWMPYGEIKPLTLSTSQMAGSPQFSPVSGSYSAGQAITLTGDSNSTIFYRINGGAIQSAASPVTTITLPAYPATVSISAYARKAGLSDSSLVAASYTISPLKSWANTYFPGVTDPAITGPTADPDRDGQSNLLEFALGGNPSLGRDGTKLRPLTADSTPTKKLLLTLAVRAGTPAFTGSPSPSATIEGITYSILGGLSLEQTTSPVSVVTLPQTTGLGAAPAGYEYRTFKLDATDGLPAKGFLRVRVTTAP